jgi:hypothetical protein
VFLSGNKDGDIVILNAYRTLIISYNIHTLGFFNKSSAREPYDNHQDCGLVKMERENCRIFAL